MEASIMLLTISYTGKQTQDLGYLLHKNTYRAQSFDLNFGHAYVFYPEVSDEKTTAALLLDIVAEEISNLLNKITGFISILHHCQLSTSV